VRARSSQGLCCTTPMTSRRITFPGSIGAALAGRLELPPGPLVGAAVFAHCFTCGKDSVAAARVSRALAERGFAVLRFDFTRIGGSDGDFASTGFSSNVEDLVLAAQHLAATVAPASLLVGHSLGGAAVLTAAAQLPEVRGVVTIGAPSDPAHVVGLLGTSATAAVRGGSAAPVARAALAGRRARRRRQRTDDLRCGPAPEVVRRSRRRRSPAHPPRRRRDRRRDRGGLGRAAPAADRPALGGCTAMTVMQNTLW
jgi:uncharacterized protein